MKAIILAAGYATRLYPLTKDRPKALLEVGSMPILDHIVENVEQIPAVDEIFIITNEKFYKHFTDWRDQRQGGLPITVYNDGTTTEDTRLGAIGDLKFTIDKGKISDDIIVLAGDNLIDFSILDFYDFYKQVDSDCVCVKKIPIEDASRMGIVQVDDNNRIVDFEEKPDKPKSDLGAFAIYIYKKDSLAMIDKYLSEGNNTDAPGNLPAWLCKRQPVYAYVFEGNCYDIGTHEAYKEVQELYKDLGR